MAIPAGSKGGYFEPLWDTGLDLQSFAAGVPQIVERDLPTVRTLGVYVNNTCNLACEHCYYQIPNGFAHASTLPAEVLIDRLRLLPGSGVRLCAFVGKEVFAPGPHGMRKTISAMCALRELLPLGGPEWLGAVTNGIFLDRALAPLADVGLDFLDVSFDGPDPDTHDRLRGNGSFHRSFGNLERAVNAGVARKVFVATTLWSGNLNTLGDILSFERYVGVRHFSIMPVVAVRGDQHAVSIDEILHFLRQVLPTAVERIRPSGPVQVVIDLDSYVVFRRIGEFSAIFDGATVSIDPLSNFLLKTERNGIELVLRVSLPDPCNSYGCITHEGLYFDKGGCLFMRNGYAEHALGDTGRMSLASLLRLHSVSAGNALGSARTGMLRYPARKGMLTDSPPLFSLTSPQLLRELEETDFYAIPELV